MTEYHSIPTIYNHILFRSRLEAKWAAFFDLCGWRWEYEPTDLDGWIPDFFLIGKEESFPVEVKPINWTSEGHISGIMHDPSLEKIHKSKNKREVLILGACIFYKDDPKWPSDEDNFLGALWEPCSEFNTISEHHLGSDLARITMLEEDHSKLDYCAEWGSYNNRLNNIYYGGHHYSPPRSKIRRLWAEATNTVQWAKAD